MTQDQEGWEHQQMKDLKKRKISARWVPHCLTTEQKQKCVDIATLLKERSDVEDQAFLFWIVAIDERGLVTLSRSWNYSPANGELQVPLGQKISKSAQSKVKQMMIFAYDHQGVIMPDRVTSNVAQK